MDHNSTTSSVRSHLTTGGAVAGAGILALGLVAAPPDTNGAGADIRPVQLTAFAQPPAAHSAALLQKYIVAQAKAVLPVVPTVVPGGATDVTAAGLPTPVTLDSAIDPATNSQQVNIAPLAATDAAYDWTQDPILYPIISFGLGVLVFVVPVLIAAVIAIPQWLFEVVREVVESVFGLSAQPAVAGASIATADATATTAATLTSDSPLSEPAPVISAKEGPAEPAPAIETGTKDDSPPEASTKSTNANTQTSTDTATLTDTPTRTEQLPATEPAAGHEQTSTDTSAATKDLTVITKADEPSAEPKAVGAHKPSAGASTSKSAKPSVRPTVPRREVGSSLGITHKGPTGEKAATTGGNPPGGDSSGGDAGVS